ncbi:type II toxin-antitoxin system RelE/ParE family toxin [Kumtagia ephedrae]|uniref:Addiction module toxin RelE n=1 Tax=Kumtagia ephedrae TaxID=2116701 RepID=A0A2P7S449_9HYPH|nr:type II toxin-antitoxin system RelE/ParE family toxin [Mesorhizobium ephedrae]PSJ57252.1 addiction module toxin RelE [Mesorhizobium ephedrae]
MQTVVETNAYLAAAKAAGMTDAERAAAIDLVAWDPHSGDIMQGTGGCRKVRLAGRSKGKSGGYRIIFAFGSVHFPVFLITVFGKGEKDNLTKAERNNLAKLTKILFEHYGR